MQGINYTDCALVCFLFFLGLLFRCNVTSGWKMYVITALDSLQLILVWFACIVFLHMQKLSSPGINFDRNFFSRKCATSGEIKVVLMITVFIVVILQYAICIPLLKMQFANKIASQYYLQYLETYFPPSSLLLGHSWSAEAINVMWQQKAWCTLPFQLRPFCVDALSVPAQVLCGHSALITQPKYATTDELATLNCR